jgi:5-methylcytosine-specific restriction protein A
MPVARLSKRHDIRTRIRFDSWLRAPVMSKRALSWSRQSSSSDVRLRGRKLQQAREELFRRNPYCVHCKAKGIARIATERDHIINLASGGTDDIDNTQGLCADCHKAKTQSESNRARGIASKPRMSTGCDARGYPRGNHHWNR